MDDRYMQPDWCMWLFVDIEVTDYYSLPTH